LSGTAIAGTSGTTVDVTGSVQNGCTFNSATYTAAFGNVVGGTVGKTSTNLDLVCSLGLPYTIYPTTDQTFVGTAQITAYQDAGYTSKLSTIVGIANTGTGDVQTIPLYFKLNESTFGPDFGEGYVILNKQTISGSMAFNLIF